VCVTLSWSKGDSNSRSLWRGKLLPTEEKGPEVDQGGLQRPVPFSRGTSGSNPLCSSGERCYGAGGEDGNFVAYINRWSAAMPQPNDLSRSLVPLDQDRTIIAVVELSQSSWLVGGVLPGIERQPRKKLEPSPERLLALLHRWRDESVRAGRMI